MHALIDYQVFCSNTPLRRFTYSKCSLKLDRERTNSSLTQAGDIQHTHSIHQIWKQFSGTHFTGFIDPFSIPQINCNSSQSWPSSELWRPYRTALKFLRSSFCLFFPGTDSKLYQRNSSKTMAGEIHATACVEQSIHLLHSGIQRLLSKAATQSLSPTDPTPSWTESKH